MICNNAQNYNQEDTLEFREAVKLAKQGGYLIEQFEHEFLIPLKTKFTKRQQQQLEHVIDEENMNPSLEKKHCPLPRSQTISNSSCDVLKEKHINTNHDRANSNAKKTVGEEQEEDIHSLPRSNAESSVSCDQLAGSDSTNNSHSRTNRHVATKEVLVAGSEYPLDFDSQELPAFPYPSKICESQPSASKGIIPETQCCFVPSSEMVDESQFNHSEAPLSIRESCCPNTEIEESQQFDEESEIEEAQMLKRGHEKDAASDNYIDHDHYPNHTSSMCNFDTQVEISTPSFGLGLESNTSERDEESPAFTQQQPYHLSIPNKNHIENCISMSTSELFPSFRPMSSTNFEDKTQSQVFDNDEYPDPQEESELMEDQIAISKAGEANEESKKLKIRKEDEDRDSDNSSEMSGTKVTRVFNSFLEQY